MWKRRPPRVVVPEAFAVAPELLGRPLAAPWRRLAAMLVDLVAIGFLALLPAFVLGVVLAGLLVRGAWRLRRAPRRRLTLGLVVGALVVLALALTLGMRAMREGTINLTVGGPDGANLEASPIEAMGLLGEVISLERAKTDEAREEIARSLLARLEALEGDPDAARELLAELASEDSSPEVRATIAKVLGDAQLAPPPGLTSELLRQHADALTAAGTLSESQRRELARIVAAPELRAARREAEGLRQELREARDASEALERPRGVRRLLGGLADDLGLGFGWSIAYFTAFLVIWRGQTPGKRLMRLRVARLDGRPFTWWLAFSRAGSYAASAITGLLGFAELLWDPNRQCMHDRIVGTVVLAEVRRSTSEARTPSAPPSG